MPCNIAEEQGPQLHCSGSLKYRVFTYLFIYSLIHSFIHLLVYLHQVYLTELSQYRATGLHFRILGTQ
jgi:hypothetical protein